MTEFDTSSTALLVYNKLNQLKHRVLYHQTVEKSLHTPTDKHWRVTSASTAKGKNLPVPEAKQKTRWKIRTIYNGAIIHVIKMFMKYSCHRVKVHHFVGRFLWFKTVSSPFFFACEACAWRFFHFPYMHPSALTLVVRNLIPGLFQFFSVRCTMIHFCTIVATLVGLFSNWAP